MRQRCLQLAQGRHDVAQEEATVAALIAQRSPLIANIDRCRANLEEARAEHGQRRGDLRCHRETRPGLFARLFHTDRWAVWWRADIALADAEANSATLLKSAEFAFSDAKASEDVLAGNIRRAEEGLALSRQRVAQLSESVDEQRRVLGDRLIDDCFFARGHEDANLASPWMPDALQREREDLFIAALAVHRAFIDAAAQKVLHNLSVLMDVFSSGRVHDEARRKLLGDLWSTLFLVVPVISTTFASVDRMLRDLPPGSIGWLLIDEAGQALPQAAVGAIMRAKRSIVVGDPIQVPPIVTLPERLNSGICKFFNIDDHVWSAPEASAQTLADHASRFQAAFRLGHRERRVGVPLLVHRRCQSRCSE